MSERVALVVNPSSGKGAGARFGAQTTALLRARGAQIKDCSGGDYAQALSRTRAAVAAGVDTVVVVGGDGMVHLGVNACAGSAARLGVVAAGTGNDFAANLKLPVRDPAGAVEVICSKGTTTIDAGRAEQADGTVRWFAGVLGAGFDAIVVERAARMTWPKGQMRYNLAMVRELPVFKPIPYAVELDGVRVDTHAMLVAVANTTSFGGGMKVTPNASLTDGLFDVLILHQISIPTFLRVFPKVFKGTHLDHPAVEVRRAGRVRLEASGIRSQADGESFVELPVTLECVPRALKVAVSA